MNHIRFFLTLFLIGIAALTMQAQSLRCGAEDAASDTTFTGAIIVNYGSLTGAANNKYQISGSLGQTFVGPHFGREFKGTAGFYSTFLLPPFPPIVKATQGDLLDRIQLNWGLDPLSPAVSAGFNIYRDGIFLATVSNSIRTYNDFNVIAGRPYNYTIRGINTFGEGIAGHALGFQVPNGVVTGWVQTPSGRPVVDALITLTPLQGFSAKFGPTDGAFVDTTDSGRPALLPTDGSPWTLSFWVKTTDADAQATILQLEPVGLRLRPLGQDGLQLDLNGTKQLSAPFPADDADGWHHVALTADGEQFRLYMDGILATLAPYATDITAHTLYLGDGAGEPGAWTGYLDELRIYHRLLDELDFPSVISGTASSLTPGLAFYWKMDEEQGTKSFDLIQRSQLYFCGATFDADRPPVRTAGITNEDGYYRIESASYGTGTTFIAHAAKDFFAHRALKFVRAEEDYALLPPFSLSPAATLELWVNSAGPDGEQCLLSKQWTSGEFQLRLTPNGVDNDLVVEVDGTASTLGQLGMGYQHLAFAINNEDGQLQAYKNGQPLGGPVSIPTTWGIWADSLQQWVLGARNEGGSYTEHFGGLIAEIAVYDTLLPVAIIQEHAGDPRDPQEAGLRLYFALDEGNGNRINNQGSVLVDPGQTFGTDWTPFAPNQSTTPHVFTPGTRQVTLNPSVTSVDQVDFVDRSTVPVSGYVRYKNTDCFAPNVEILVNGDSYSPPVYTDSTGRFVVDLDPGASAVLSPQLADHDFLPASWEVINVSNPIAGILFNDVTTRTVSGQVAGGLCKKSIIQAPPGEGQGTFVIVKLRSANGCLERQILLDNQEGRFEFTEVPPLEAMTIAVVEHSNPSIKTYFEVEGGKTLDLTERDTTVEFIYFAPPEVAITSGLEPVSETCETIVLDQGFPVTLDIKLLERYVPTPADDGICYLDTAGFRIVNGFADEVVDTVLSGETLQYKFKVGVPNPSPPFIKTLQVIGTTLDGREASLTEQAIVTGIRSKENTFTTMLPETPTIILRDPPGDKSYAYLEKNTKVCKTHVVSLEQETGGGSGIELNNGGKQEVVVGIGVATVQGAEWILDEDFDFLLTHQTIDNSSFKTCITLNEKLATSDGELIVGGQNGADLYMGDAINLVFGLADEVTFNPVTCQPEVKTVINIEPGDFSTVFIYSEFHIRNNVLRYLDSLLVSPNITPQDSINFVESKKRWQNILEANAELKEKADLVRNISFDAGVTYENSETYDTSYAKFDGSYFNHEEISLTRIGYEWNKFGIVGKAKFYNYTTDGTLDESDTFNSIKTGYVMNDNDPANSFSVDVKMDAVFRTPIFDIIAGQSSCPWEPGTANRDAPNLELAEGSQFVAENVPAHEAAVFQFNLGNLSASNEDRTYGFMSVTNNNPHGAIIKLNGMPLNNNRQLISIPYGTSVPVTVTVERGPVEYDYDSLRVLLYPECELERAFALGIPIDEIPEELISSVYLGAHFIRPCSEVAINVPQQDWVIYPDDPTMDGSLMRITVSGYDKDEPFFERVRVQYRRSDGDGAWINITPESDVLREDLGDIFTQLYWDTEGLSDGPYEIRAVAICAGDASDRPGYSEVIKGRIDREPPSLIGMPEPADGVYQVGDEISFTFNKQVNCNRLIPADQSQANNVGLYDATTGQLLDIKVTCYENKIYLEPLSLNSSFENHILRAELHNIEDLTGNSRDFLQWEFYVDRNELAWLTDSLGMIKYENDTRRVTASIHNRGGYPVPFEITSVPDWVRVVPDKGTMVANEIRPITFEVDSTLAFGSWADTILMVTAPGESPNFFMGGTEPLPFGVRVVCRPPDWKLQAGSFENSMNLVLELNIEGTISLDEEDIVVAYIGDTLCGKAQVQYIDEVDHYLVYLTVFGNPNHVDQPIRLEIWDATACLRYGLVTEFFTFQPNHVIGSAESPQVIHTQSLVLREIPLGYGWNWVSFNLNFPDNSLDSALTTLRHPANDIIRSQTDFTVYTGTGWEGPLANLDAANMYIYKTDRADTIKMLGTLIDPLTTDIPLVAGWNWIGYIPNNALPINDALSSLRPSSGDLIKSQLAFAQYLDEQYGWVGSLRFLQPPNGYQIHLTESDVLTYPAGPLSKNLTPRGAKNNEEVATYWTVNPSRFEFGMTMIAMLAYEGQNITGPDMELGAFSGNELRGSARAIYIEATNANHFFLTCYGNENGEELNFRLYDPATDQIYQLAESMTFASDRHWGSVETPLPFSTLSTGTDGTVFEQTYTIQPNPFREETVFRFSLQRAQPVVLTIFDMNGRVVAGIKLNAMAGTNELRWQGTTSSGQLIADGVYFARLQSSEGMASKKLIRQR